MDLERGFDNTINVAWTEPGEWLTYTVEHEGNGTVVLDVAVRYGNDGVRVRARVRDRATFEILSEWITCTV